MLVLEANGKLDVWKIGKMAKNPQYLGGGKGVKRNTKQIYDLCTKCFHALKLVMEANGKFNW